MSLVILVYSGGPSLELGFTCRTLYFAVFNNNVFRILRDIRLIIVLLEHEQRYLVGNFLIHRADT